MLFCKRDLISKKPAELLLWTSESLFLWRGWNLDGAPCCLWPQNARGFWNSRVSWDGLSHAEWLTGDLEEAGDWLELWISVDGVGSLWIMARETSEVPAITCENLVPVPAWCGVGGVCWKSERMLRHEEPSEWSKHEVQTQCPECKCPWVKSLGGRHWRVVCALGK